MKLERIRAIPDTAVTQIDLSTFEIKSQSDKYGEVNYMVYYSARKTSFSCTCPDYLYRNTEEQPDYECKHIGKVRDLLTRRLKN